jgi:hypothetical protein
MLKARKVEDSWYPQRGDYKSDQEFNNIRQLTDRIYKLQDQLAVLHKKSSTAEIGGKKEKPPNGASNTKIAGLYVVGEPPKHQQVLMYNANSGQIEWGDVGP